MFPVGTLLPPRPYYIFMHPAEPAPITLSLRMIARKSVSDHFQ